jgi:hypothetical protein
MRQALKRKTSNRGAVSNVRSLPAPVRGWYVADGLASAPERTAYVLDNWFPEQDACRLFRGSIEHATGMGSGSVQSLMSYVSGTTKRLFACANNAIYDVTSTGAVGAAAVSSLSNNRWEHVQFTTTGTSYLWACNGADAPRAFNGSTWVTPTITGITASTIDHVWTHARRLFFVIKDTTDFAYLPVDSFQGAAAVFSLGGVFSKGGKLLMGATWSSDAGQDLQDLCAFISSEGEVAVYSGINPGSATEWSLVGVYQVGKPLSKRSAMKAGGDLLIMTQSGIVPLSRAVALDQAALAEAAVTRPIAPEWKRIVEARLDRNEWQITPWLTGQMAIVTVPNAGAEDKTQFISNIVTGAWCRRKGWGAICFGVHDNKLYYGATGGKVYQAEIGGRDEGSQINGVLVHSWTGLGSPAENKVMLLAQPLMESTVSNEPTMTIATDFAYSDPVPVSAPSSPLGSIWGTAKWGTGVWGGGKRQIKTWRAVAGTGSYVALVLQASISSGLDQTVRYTASNLVFEKGVVL